MRNRANLPAGQDEGEKRRLYPRFEANAECTVTLPEAGEQPRPAVVRDFSKTGLRLCVDFALGLGDVVQVDLADDRFFGRVVHCHTEGAWYILGLALAQPISKEKLDTLIRDLALNHHR